MSRRIPWVAAGMSAILPGFGQLYNARINHAIWFFLVFAALLIPGTTLASLYLPTRLILPLFIACLLIGISAWLLSIFDAYIQASKQQNHVIKPWQTAGLYTLILVLFSTVLLPIMINYVRQHQVQTFYVHSSSMNPTLQRGDLLFADMRYNCPTCKVAVSPGDVAVVVNPNNRTEYFIKRIVGLPGDRIEMTDEVVPDGHVFVLGDNRDSSKDSRNFGTLPLIDVIGKARQIWYSKSGDGVEWDRIGQVIQ